MNDQKIILLDEIEHVLQVPTRYIGSISPTEREDWILNPKTRDFEFKKFTVVPAFITLFREIISNSIDEYIKTKGKYANKISVKFNGKYFTIRDNGRGLPHQKEEKTGLPQSVIAFTRLKAGDNFVSESKTIGMHGEGCCLTNIFAKHFIVNTSDGIKKTHIECRNNLSDTKFKLSTNRTKFTEIKWLPDYQRLNIASGKLDDEHINYIKKVILELSVCYRDIKFTYNSKKISVNSFKDYVKKYSDVFEVFTHENIDIAVIPNTDFAHVSFVNGIYTRLGGWHVDIISHAVIREIRELLKKRFKEIKPYDIKQKLFFIINVRNMSNPKFSSQVKEELTNTSEEFGVDLFIDINFEKIAKKIRNNKIILENIIETFKIKEQLKRNRELEQKQKKIKTKSIPKLIETYNRDRENCRLYITEGKSATMNFLTCRKKNYAAYPLKGKFMNCYNAPKSKIIKNAEIQDLLATTALKLTSKSIANLRYGKIIIFTDADYDGDAICSLLIAFFRKFWPDIIREGRLYRAITPLVTAKNIDTKEVRYFFNLDEYNKACEEENWKMINYNKGLGSLTEDEYSFSLDNLSNIIYDNNAKESLELAFGNNADLRKSWLLNEI